MSALFYPIPRWFLLALVLIAAAVAVIFHFRSAAASADAVLTRQTSEDCGDIGQAFNAVHAEARARTRAPVISSLGLHSPGTQIIIRPGCIIAVRSADDLQLPADVVFRQGYSGTATRDTQTDHWMVTDFTFLEPTD